jgi:DNA-binding LacI/PurR family transcriptional regulator
MPITIRDIAKKLNLSIAAVSRALGEYSDISVIVGPHSSGN